MNWFNIQIWRKCFVSTLICLIGCSVGTMGTANYLRHYNWPIVVFASFIIGYITCVIFMVLWQSVIHTMNFKAALKMSVKMSLVSIIIMMLTEISVMLINSSVFSNHQMHDTSQHNYGIMIAAMSLGFLFALPYNYHQLYNNNTICH